MNHPDVTVTLTMPSGEPMISIFGDLRARGYSIVCTGPGTYKAVDNRRLNPGVRRRTTTPPEAA